MQQDKFDWKGLSNLSYSLAIQGIAIGVALKTMRMLDRTKLDDMVFIYMFLGVILNFILIKYYHKPNVRLSKLSK